jgi:hypothetical protein
MIEMKTRHIYISTILYSLIFIGGSISFCPRPAYASGQLRRLTGISSSMDRMKKQGAKEEANYQKADAFLGSPDIKQGISADDLLAVCGAPVARAGNNTRWVYKPPTSTFFEGEKIYFYFDNSQKLTGWEKVYQK